MKSPSDNWMMRVAIGLVCGQTVLAMLAKKSFALTVYGDIAQSILLLLGLALMWTNSSRSHGRRRLFWMLMSVGFALWLISQAMWTYYEVLARHEVPNPFMGDVVVFIHLVPMMAALTLQIESEGAGELLNLGSVDVLALLLWWLYLYLFTVIPWQFVVFDVERYGRSFNVLYLTEHLVFLIGLGVLWLRSFNAGPRTDVRGGILVRSRFVCRRRGH